MKCKHKWVDTKDGSLDKFCVICKKFAMQARMTMPMSAEMSAPNSMPAARETMEVPFYNGSEHTRITVYKDDLIKQMHREMGLSNHLFGNRLGC